MKINGKVEVKGFTTVNDLEAGTVFCFLDESTPYILCCEEVRDYCQSIVDLENGILYNDEEHEELWRRPVRVLNATLNIEDNAK